MSKQRLQLTWYNKDMALIPTETGKYGYTWVEPDDPRYCEAHTLVMDQYVRGGRLLRPKGWIIRKGQTLSHRPITCLSMANRAMCSKR